MKHCHQCGAHKDVHDFYARRAVCKDCVKAQVRQNYSKNRDHYRDYERRRSLLPHRVEARERYASTPQGRDRSTQAKRAYIERNESKRTAHNAVDNAVRDNRLWRSPCCMAPGCFSTDRIHGHHTNYSEPLCVVWLCASCHSRLHKEHNRRQLNAA